MDTRSTLLDGAAAGSRSRPACSFWYLLSAYFVPRGLFVDPETQGSWGRWSRRRHNLEVLRLHSFTFARRWAALWLLGSGPGRLLGGTMGDVIMLLAGMAIVPAVVFACARLAAGIAGDDLPL
ncbi:MAG TPA: hypothetical protein VH105_08550 [Burkholderiales bacterium]|jgi:hypothetical protein|nr:hypothetical protein [Burkholderiales bacterium]